LPVVFVTGVASAGVLVPLSYIVQTVTPDHLLGRTWTLVGALPTALQVMAPAAAALALRGIGIGGLFASAAAGLVLVGLMTAVLERSLPVADRSGDETGRSSDETGKVELLAE
jgi:hypothetical protein